MTKLLEKAFAEVRELPPDSQDEIARAMLILAGESVEAEQIDPSHLADVMESLAQAKRREFATEADVEAAFRRFDRCSCGSRRARLAISQKRPIISMHAIPRQRCAYAR